jgi:arylsulfatase A-like enzyme
MSFSSYSQRHFLILVALVACMSAPAAGSWGGPVTAGSVEGPVALGSRSNAIAATSPARQAAHRPNIVFILMDDLGWTDAGYLGSDFYETPNLDRLAGQGMVFTDAYSNAPSCAPSRASLLSGQYPPRHGIYAVVDEGGEEEAGDAEERPLIPVESRSDLDLGIVTIAEVLQDAGYSTGYVGKWHLGGVGHLPEDQGFDFSIAAGKQGSPPSYFYPYSRGSHGIRDLVDGGSEGEYLTDRLTDEAIGFIERNHTAPFFLFLSHYAVHTPRQAKDELIEKYRKKADSMGRRQRDREEGKHFHPVYAAMIESVDQGVGRLMASLDQLDLTRDTFVVFFSDNGGHPALTSLAPLRGSKGTFYEGGIRVPLIVRWPGRVAPGSSTSVPVIGTDFFPTLLAVAGIEPPPGKVLDGVNLLPILVGSGVLGDRGLFWHFPLYGEEPPGVAEPMPVVPPLGVIHRGDYKLIEYFEDERLELYDLRDDIGEQHDLSGQMPEKAEELRGALATWRETVHAPLPSRNPAYAPEMGSQVAGPAARRSAGSSLPEIVYATGDWDSESLGNHRAVVRVESPAVGTAAADRAGAGAPDAVRVRIPWRRRDAEPERKNIVIVDAATGERIENIARIDINREFGDLVFQPATVPGDYFVYYMPWVSEGRSNYPTVTYPGPEVTADADWLRRQGLEAPAGAGADASAEMTITEGSWQSLPGATVTEIQSIDELNSFYPMEVIATAAEMEALAAENPGASYLLFPEDRRYPIRMTDDLPLRWIEAGPQSTFKGAAARGEFYAFQVGVYAMREDLEDLRVELTPLQAGSSPEEGGGSRPPGIPATAVSSFNLGGVDPAGEEFTKEVDVERGEVQALWFGVQIPEDADPGLYRGTLTVAPVGIEAEKVSLEIEVLPEEIEAAGDNEPWRHSRLRWLDSRIAFDDEIVKPYTPVEIAGDTVSILGRQVDIDESGFPRRIRSYFAPEMTHLQEQARGVLHGPIELLVERGEDDPGDVLKWNGSGPSFAKHGPGRVTWVASSLADGVTMAVEGEMEFDGNIELTVALTAARPTPVNDIRLRIPLAREVAKYMMGMGLRGGLRPDEHHWKWDVATKNQDGAWIGDVSAGLQFSLRDENYDRPLNTNFYLSKPLVEPISWANGGRGGCDLVDADVNPEGLTAETISARLPAFLVTCTSGARTLQPDEPLYFNVRLALTPFRPIDTGKQWSTRFYHRFSPVEEIAAMGANTINVHHATDINPYINYPFLRPDEMKAYVDEAHAHDMRVKIYYTVRELSNRAPELFALRSLGDEIFSTGPGGGWSWLQEHLVSDYIAAWFVPRLRDAAIINSGVSRWHNYYLEGLNWLVNNIGIDGLYIDDVAFDRTTMKRLRKILDRARPQGLIDLHSANQYNERDGFTNSANLYLEHFPYIDRLWFGEYFDYDAQPDFWLIEVSGIPFGLMGEMLQDGGNPWRGMLYGMTNRLPYGGHDPSPIWQVWDDFGIEESRMIGYWVPDAPVTADHADVLATAYVADGKTLVSIASWADEPVEVRLAIDWEALGVDPSTARIRAPAVRDFQPAASFTPADPIPVEPGRGWLLIIEAGSIQP